MRFFLMALSLLLLPFSGRAFTPHMTCPGEITIEGEWIYFSPTSETSYYANMATITSPFVVQSREANRLDDFYSGYRVGAAYNFGCNNFLAATWTDLQAKHRTEVNVSSPTVISPILIPAALLGIDAAEAVFGDFASDQIQFHYFALEVVGGQKLLSFMCFDVTGFGGIHYARLHSKEEYFYSLTIPDVSSFSGENRSTFWGLGPELGFILDRDFGYGFSICGTATGAFLIGKPLDKNFSEGFDAGGVAIRFSDVTNQRAWRVVPYADIRIGVNYALDCLFSFCNLTCIHGNLEIGYEVPVYFNALSKIEFPNSTQIAVSFDDYRNVTMHGVYGALSLSF